MRRVRSPVGISERDELENKDRHGVDEAVSAIEMAL
jgi:hypothetical protein